LNGTDLFPLVADRARRSHLPLYFLGGTLDVVRAAAQRCVVQYPGLELVGYESGFFEAVDEAHVVRRINRSGAQMLLVGRGAPLQDEFVLRWCSELDVSVVWAVGGLFDFLSGAKPRAPNAIRRLRLEWLYRFLHEPRRMWFRNVPEPVWFAARVISQRWLNGAQS
jgi:exopolysaccharide biosynthesis WecB/TagA/CpsF family protein